MDKLLNLTETNPPTHGNKKSPKGINSHCNNDIFTVTIKTSIHFCFGANIFEGKLIFTF